MVRTDAEFIMNQFRAPYSLTEILHDGFIFVQDSLERIAMDCKENSTYFLQMIKDKLQELENLYTQMYAKSALNEIRRDERDFLQNLICRLDQMIQHLENDESYSPQDQELLKKNLNLLQA